MDLKKVIREIPDFPKPGVNFKDISTLIKSGPAFHYAIGAMAATLKVEARYYRRAGVTGFCDRRASSLSVGVRFHHGPKTRQVAGPGE